MEATVLVMLFPLLVAAGEMGLLGRRLTGNLIVGGLIAFIGTSVIALGAPGGRSHLMGDLMALGAAFLFAVSLLISAQLFRRNNVRAVTLWVIIGASISAFPAALIEQSILPASTYGWAYLTVYGVLTFAGYALYNTALSKLPTTLVAVSGFGQTIIASIIFRKIVLLKGSEITEPASTGGCSVQPRMSLETQVPEVMMGIDDRSCIELRHEREITTQ